MPLGLKVVPIGVALLLRVPALPGEEGGTHRGDLRQRPLGFGLALRCLGLLQPVPVLRDLVLDFGGGDNGEQLSRSDVVADIDKAPEHIAAGARIDVCLLEGERRPRQCHMHPARTLRHLLDAHRRHKVDLLVGKGDDLMVLLLMAPHAKSKTAENE